MRSLPTRCNVLLSYSIARHCFCCITKLLRKPTLTADIDPWIFCNQSLFLAKTLIPSTCANSFMQLDDSDKVDFSSCKTDIDPWIFRNSGTFHHLGVNHNLNPSYCSSYLISAMSSLRQLRQRFFNSFKKFQLGQQLLCTRCIVKFIVNSGKIAQ